MPNITKISSSYRIFLKNWYRCSQQYLLLSLGLCFTRAKYCGGHTQLGYFVFFVRWTTPPLDATNWHMKRKIHVVQNKVKMPKCYLFLLKFFCSTYILRRLISISPARNFYIRFRRRNKIRNNAWTVHLRNHKKVKSAYVHENRSYIVSYFIYACKYKIRPGGNLCQYSTN